MSNCTNTNKKHEITGKKLKIGIDPGVNTGIAVWDIEKRQIIDIQTFRNKLHRALDYVRKLYEKNEIVLAVYEDARLWKVHNAKNWNYGRLQGAGSVKRDSQIWEAFLSDYNIPFRAVQPNKTRNALAANKKQFRAITGWQGRVSEHGRDAAMLIVE